MPLLITKTKREDVAPHSTLPNDCILPENIIERSVIFAAACRSAKVKGNFWSGNDIQALLAIGLKQRDPNLLPYLKHSQRALAHDCPTQLGNIQLTSEQFKAAMGVAMTYVPSPCPAPSVQSEARRLALCAKSYGRLSDVGLNTKGEPIVTERGSAGTSLRVLPIPEAKLAFFGASQKLGEKAFLKIAAPDQLSLSFSKLQDFNPCVGWSRSPQPLKNWLAEYIDRHEVESAKSRNCFNTFRARPDWSSSLFKEIKKYFSNEGKSDASALGVENFEFLTPRQAISLSLLFVRHFTRYYENSTKGETPADKTDIFDLLDQAKAARANGTFATSFQGNGVCRNFAEFAKLAFEAIKENQGEARGEDSMLTNCFCLRDGGAHFLPRRYGNMDIGNNVIDFTTHAWTSFLVVEGDQVEITFADPTWGEYTGYKGLASFDQSVPRAAEFVELCVRDKYWSNEADRATLQAGLNYFLLAADTVSGESAGVPTGAVQTHFINKALNLAKLSKMPVPVQLLQQLTKLCEDPVNVFRVGRCHLSEVKDCLQGDSQGLFRELVDKWLSRRGVSPQGLESELGSFTPANFLSEVFDSLQASDSLNNLLSKSGALRRFYREMYPERLPNFDPTKNTADFLELKRRIGFSHAPQSLTLGLGPTLDLEHRALIVADLRDFLPTAKSEERLESARLLSLLGENV